MKNIKENEIEKELREIEEEGIKESANELCDNCNADISHQIEKAFQSKQKDVLELIDEIDNPYPIDVFPEITKKQFSQISNYLETIQGFPLDRLSAHIGRLILKGIKDELQKLGEIKNGKNNN